jgi:trehalose synthase
MLHLVDIGPRRIEAYRGVAPDELIDGLKTVARELGGARILHVNATPYGGGVSELLRSAVPIVNDLGLVADWRIIAGDDTFFHVTKKIHNGLQGAAEDLTQAEREAYLTTSRHNAQLLEEVYDIIFLHDPQPAAIREMHGHGTASWIWRCHIDTSAPNPAVWSFLQPYLAPFDAAVFTMEQFVPPGFPVQRVRIIPPAIDPLSPKNMPLADATARQVLEWIGVELDRPLVTQVSRFDPWKDPLGMIAAYRLARKEIPTLQLALIGSMALDDPEGWDVYHQVKAESSADPDIHIFTNLIGVGNVEVNAFQRLSQVVVQKSVREGFGLVVSEALWKGTPVVAGRAGGIPLQMADNAGGVLVDDVESCAAAIVALVRDRKRAGELGQRGHDRVRQQFLIPRMVLDELHLVRELVSGHPLAGAELAGADKDPVCGMTVGAAQPVLTAEFGGTTYRFCSFECRRRFLREPRHFVGEPPQPEA